MVKKELEEVFGLFFFVPNDTAGVLLIYIQSLFTCNRMNADNRMLVKVMSEALEALVRLH